MEGSQGRSLGDAVFNVMEPALLIVTSGGGEVFVMGKLHDYVNHVFFWKKLKKLKGKATVPDSTIYCSKVDKYGTNILSCCEIVLNILS